MPTSISSGTTLQPFLGAVRCSHGQDSVTAGDQDPGRHVRPRHKRPGLGEGSVELLLDLGSGLNAQLQWEVVERLVDRSGPSGRHGLLQGCEAPTLSTAPDGPADGVDDCAGVVREPRGVVAGGEVHRHVLLAVRPDPLGRQT